MSVRYEGPFHQSHIALYLKCPRMFYYEKVRGMKPEYVTASAIFGRGIHRAIEDIHGYRLGKEELIRRSLKYRLDQVVDETEEEIQWRGEYEERFEDAVTYLSVYASKEVNREARVLAAEQSFRLDIGSYTFEGTYDQLRNRDDQLILVDFKSGDWRPSEDFLRRSYQLSLYAYAIWKECGRIPDEIWWYQLKDHLPYKRAYKGKQAGEERGPAIYKTFRTEQDLAYLENDLRRVCQAIRFNMFFRSPSQVGSCNGFCRFKDECLGEMESPGLSRSQLDTIKEVA